MRRLFRRVSALVYQRRLQRDLADEMAAHLEMMSPGRRQDFGGMLKLQEEAGDQWGWTWLDHLRQDLLYGPGPCAARRDFR
jgi:hypothetical protein